MINTAQFCSLLLVQRRGVRPLRHHQLRVVGAQRHDEGADRAAAGGPAVQQAAVQPDAHELSLNERAALGRPLPDQERRVCAQQH